MTQTVTQCLAAGAASSKKTTHVAAVITGTTYLDAN